MASHYAFDADEADVSISCDLLVYAARGPSESMSVPLIRCLSTIMSVTLLAKLTLVSSS